MPPLAVLFDFDGVIADTENIHVAAWQRTFGVMGWEESDATCARAAELDDQVFVAEVFARRKIEDGDADGWAMRKQALAARLLADAPRVYPGVVELVGRLQEKARLAIVSTASRGDIETVLASAGLAGAFEVIVSKDDAHAPKPDPEPYRLALSRLGLAPGEAVALEDSPTGLASARAAGVRVVAVGHRRPAGEWAEGSAFVPDLSDLRAVLDAIGRSA